MELIFVWFSVVCFSVGRLTEPAHPRPALSFACDVIGTLSVIVAFFACLLSMGKT